MQYRHCGFDDLVRVIEAHTVDCAPAAIVSGNGEASIAERCHDLYLVLCHRAKRIVRVIQGLGRRRTVAVAWVSRDNVKALRELRRRHARNVRQRIAMQQKQVALPPCVCGPHWFPCRTS
jgi:hypothetical protein